MIILTPPAVDRELTTNMKLIKYQRVAIVALTYVSVEGLTYAQEEDTIVVTASRLPESQLEASSKVEVITAAEVETRQQVRLQDALTLTPGVISTSTAGQEGQTGTLIIRGLPTRYNQVLVDGVRISDSIGGGTYANFFGNLNLEANDQVEIAKGSQGVVHGNSAIGGVVGIYGEFADKAPSLQLSQEVGEYDYSYSQISSSGSVQGVQYYVNGSYSNQDGDFADVDAFNSENAQFSAGAKFALNSSQSVEVSVRENQSDLVSGTSIIGNDVDLLSLKLLSSVNESFQSSAVLGYFDESYHFDDFNINYTRTSFTIDNQYTVNDLFLFSGGLDVSVNDYRSGSNEQEWETYALYLGGKLTAGDFIADLSIRGEEHSLFGFMPSTAFSVKYNLDEISSELFFKASNAFRAPNFNEANAFPGFPAFGIPNQLANDSLDEENITSFEFGVTTDFSDVAKVSVSAYSHFLNDALGFVQVNANERQVQNLSGVSEIYGLEASLKGTLNNVSYLLSWNHAAKNDLLNLPRNTLNANIYYDHNKWLVGGGVSHQSGAEYTGFVRLDARTITRLYGHYNVTDSFKINARIENLFNEEYNVNPFGVTEGRGVATYLGATLSF